MRLLVRSDCLRVVLFSLILDDSVQDGVTYVTQSSFQDALVALGASLNIVDAVLSVSHSSPPVAFALVRPPGHHATADTPLGFCLFNNIAIAAKYAQKHHDIRRVLIVDFDVHNGNGTCETFWEDDSVLVIDVHEESTVYPSPEFIPSQEKDIGSGRGSGYTINVPFPRYAGHESVVMLWEQIVIPAARRFQPQAIMVSAGYDGHVMDPFQLLQYEDRTYHYMASTLKTLADELCRGRLMFFLEGGYDLTALGSAVTETWRAVLGERPGEKTVGHTSVIPEKEPVQDVRSLVRRLQDIHGL